MGRKWILIGDCIGFVCTFSWIPSYLYGLDDLLGRKQNQGLRISLMVFLKLQTSGLPPEVQLIVLLLNRTLPP